MDMTHSDLPRAENPFRRGRRLRLVLELLLLALCLAALGHAAWRAYAVPWMAYGDGSMDYLARADPRALSGGDLTHFHLGALAFEQPAPNLAWGWEKLFDDGDGVFERPFTPAVASGFRYDADGLGPIYNHEACEACHVADGRARPVLDPPGAPQDGLLLRLSVPGAAPGEAPRPHPVYGGQLGDRGIVSDGVPVPPEGRVAIRYQERAGRYPDGTPYTLLVPHYRIEDPQYGPLGADLLVSPRIAPAVFGVGLLEAVPESTVLALAKEQARAQDGITGRAQWLRDPREGTRVLGRFGWKAETATVEQQALDAALNDMGVTSGRFPHQPCTEAQRACREARHGGSVDAPELTAEQAEALVVYLQLLGVPARRDLDEPQVRRGEAAFSAAGCASCHVPELRTGGHDIERLNGQTIRPYTDLLLHDMGPGLADGRPSHEASGREWRTAPLWGIGLVPTVNGHSRYLHDGRARSLEEAVLWHGGEAEAAKLRFMQMSREERDALLRFLNSL